ncbi:XPG domain containing-domain-containing protein [Terfezia claveryi]|nr:XPG domain containing-domain-containing protein [Terfezia claveryi]
MGIPGLYSLLRPYAQPFTFPTPTPESEQSTHLYIDGPALAYHVYHTSLNANYYDSLGRVRRNPFEAVVEYDEFVEDVGAFLGRLEEVGFVIQKVFFDGYLPKVKLPTRLSRLSHSLSQLKAYHSLHPTHIPSFNSSHRHASSSVRAIPTSRPHSLPSPPFIVSTALSHLVGSKWKELVETVPGEADAWCASAAVRQGGWVMTGDTDLLLYGHDADEIVDEEGAERVWGVMMFRDFSFFQQKGKDETDHWVVKAMVFRPNHLNKALFGREDRTTILAASPGPSKQSSSGKKKGGKKPKRKPVSPAPAIIEQFNQTKSPKATARQPSLLNLAHHLQNEPCAGMARLKQLVKASSLLPDVSQREMAFRREYVLVTPPPLEPREKLEGKSPVPEVDIEWQIKHLDPRFSELVYQLPCLSNQVHPPMVSALSTKRTRKAGEAEEIEVDSFLPFLYEDPTRSGAWDVGREIRGVVYGILEAYQNKVSREQRCAAERVKLVVKEHVRKGNRIKEVPVEGEGVAMTPGKEMKRESILTQRLAEYIETWKSKRDKPSAKGGTKRERSCGCSNYWWVEMAVEMIVRDYAEKGKDMPLSSEVGVIVHMLSQAAKGAGRKCGEEEKADEEEQEGEEKEEEEGGVLKKPRSDSPQDQKSGPPQTWTWSMIHLFAQVQAGVYSLWMLKQLMVFALALGDTLSMEERKNVVDLATLLNRVPPVENVIAGKKFLEGMAKQQDGVNLRHCQVCGFGEDLIMVIENAEIWNYYPYTA